jgi:hypothetical protein
MEGLRKATKFYGSPCSGWHSNRVPPKYKLIGLVLDHPIRVPPCGLVGNY